MEIIIFLLIVITAIIIICLKVKKTRLKIALLAGMGLSILSFFIFLLLMFSLQRTILLVLLGIFFISIIVFLIIWNIYDTKKIYLILCIPIMCMAAGIGVIVYQEFIGKIPTVSEQDIYLYRYTPFTENNLLSKLDEESTFIIINNFPVLDGATALYPVYASFAQAVYPVDEYKNTKGLVLCSRTNGAYENLLNRDVDIIFCAEQ